MTLLISCETGGQCVPAHLVSPGLGVQDMDTPVAIESIAQARSKSSRAEHGKTKSRAARRLSTAGGSTNAGAFTATPGGLPALIRGDAAGLYAARRIARRLDVTPIENTYSQTLVDVTRSTRHRELFSPIARGWSDADKLWLVDNIHTPYRNLVQDRIESMLRSAPYVLHLSVRSFDLRSNGKLRRADAGLLYDPANENEVDFSVDWVEDMYWELPMLRVRRNYPGRGTNDSLTKAMRTFFEGRPYIGVELRLNRAWVGRPLAVRDEVLDGIADSLDQLLAASQAEAA